VCRIGNRVTVPVRLGFDAGFGREASTVDSRRFLHMGAAASVLVNPKLRGTTRFVSIFPIKTEGGGPIGRWTEELMSMATAVIPGSQRPVLVPARKARPFPSLSGGRAVSSSGDLTIHRITSTHHGRTLLTLGHAAEYLANSRRYSTQKYDHTADVEAIHILMGLSRSVFEDFAGRPALHRRVQDWVVERAVRLFDREVRLTNV
jgi:hypothetical protein